MRLLLVVALPLWMTSGCSPSHASERATDGTLLLEVGGGHASLRGSLQAAGIQVAAPQPLQPVEPVASVPTGQPIADPVPALSLGLTDLAATPESAQPVMLQTTANLPPELPRIRLPESMEAVVR